MIDDTVAEIGVNTKGASCLFNKRYIKAACGGNSRYRKTCCPGETARAARKNNHPECNLRTLSSVLTRHNFQCPDTLYFLSVCTLILLPSLILTSGPYFPVLPPHLLQFRRQFRHPVRLWVCSSFCSLFSLPPSVTAPKYNLNTSHSM